MEITQINYKIKKNYLKYLISKKSIYIEKIHNLIFTKKNQIKNQTGGNINSIELVLNNIDLIISNLDYFINIINVINKHDKLMKTLNSGYVGFDSKQNIIDYINKIYNNEKNFLKIKN